MHVLLIPIGSHGDVHPFVGLGLALKARGHAVTLATNEHFAGLAERVGLDFVPLGSEERFRAALNDPDLWHPMKGFRLTTAMFAELMEPTFRLIEERATPETVVAAPITAYGARLAEEKLGTRLVTVDLQPALIRSAIAPPELPKAEVVRSIPVWARGWFYRLMDAALVDPILAPPINAFRRRLGMRKVTRILEWWHSPRRVLGLYPDWFGPPQADWPANVKLVGFPLFDESTHAALDDEVARFLDAGGPPIVFTAGSAMVHGSDFFAAAVGACERLGRRGILLARFGEQIPVGLPPSVRHFHYVPFSQILPRSAALVHHGGIGTTAQGLAAGVPQLVMPLAHDQPDNAVRLERLGVGRWIRPAEFRAETAAAALGALIDDAGVGARARELASRIDPASALERACRVIEEGMPLASPATAGG